MILSFEELTSIFPNYLWLELPSEAQQKAWEQSQNEVYSNAFACWNAYLNSLCLDTFVSWLKEAVDLQEAIEIWPQKSYLPSFWEVVNGTAITLGATRLVLIPSDKSNLLEFRIPQEWVDIPSWAANYYIAVQLNLEECWLRVWGYANYQQIQKQAKHDRMDGTYCVDREELINDLNVMWVARELYPYKKPQVKPQPSLPPAQIEKLVQQLSSWTPYSPRLDVPFHEWAAVLASDEFRQRLYRLRVENLQGASKTVAIAQPTQPRRTNLSQWFQNLFETGWESVDALLATNQRTLAVQFRSDSTLNELPVKRAKLIDLGMQLGNQAVVLLVGIAPEIDGKVSIRVQLYPAPGVTYLPSNLRLALLSESGTNLQEVVSRNSDNYIQLKRFKSLPGKSFSILINRDDASIQENFVIEALADKQP